MADAWEYYVSRITWIPRKRLFQTLGPDGQQGEDSDIGVLLNYWGAEDWELVSVAVERYGLDAGWISGRLVVAVPYRAFFKRRTQS